MQGGVMHRAGVSGRRSARLAGSVLAGLVAGAILLGLASAAAEDKKYGPGVTDTEIKLGQTAPYSGAASSFGATTRAIGNYFKMINASGGINGRKINLISLDDAYSPPKTVEQTRRLVDGDEVLAITGTLGTPGNLAIAKYLNARKIPQLLAMSGSAKLNDPEKLPWTTTFYASQDIESAIYARYVLKNKPNAKIAVLYQNDDYGKGYFNGFKAALGDKASMVIAEATYDVTFPTIESELVKLAASGADTIFYASTPKFTAQAIRKAHEIGWKPLQIVITASSQTDATLKPAGLEASTGLLTSLWQKVPNDPIWADDKSMQQFQAFMKQWAPAEAGDIFLSATGYSWAQTMAEILRKCGDDLTRENLLKQATNLEGFHPSLFIDGVNLNTSPSDRTPWRQAKMARFNGSSWEPFGDIVTIQDDKQN
jgi:ABC-type branched-subunit amino acid transport system substrate-binding protein